MKHKITHISTYTHLPTGEIFQSITDSTGIQVSVDSTANSIKDHFGNNKDFDEVANLSVFAYTAIGYNIKLLCTRLNREITFTSKNWSFNYKIKLEIR